jgi:hypothetical protein
VEAADGFGVIGCEWDPRTNRLRRELSVRVYFDERMETNSTHQLLVRRVNHRDILDYARGCELLSEYAEECSIPQIGTSDPQREIYAAMEKSGLMHCFGLFDDRSIPRLIGFATLLIHVLPHYGKRIANVESLFVGKAHRAYGAGEILKVGIEQYAKEQGCVGILYNARAGSRLEKLLTLQPEYERTNSVFLRSFAGAI